MKILCGYAGDNLRPETKTTLAKFTVDYVDMSGDDFAYWQNICKRWTGKDDLLIIEQDIGITADVVPSFEGCPEPWCVYSYTGPLGEMLYYALGCTRFRKELQLAVPHARISDQPLHWRSIDGKVSARLGLTGYTPHIHGELEHHHDYPEDKSLLGSSKEKSAEDFMRRLASLFPSITIDLGEED
jgi:hypothetical protein